MGVTWFGAAAFCNFLSERDGRKQVYDTTSWRPDWSSNGYRLPTEAEWEFAARGPQGRKFPWGDLIGKKNANFASSRDPFESLNPPYTQNGGPTTPVGFFDGRTLKGEFQTDDSPSPFGLYDMAGNVIEWCDDLLGPYNAKIQVDPKGPLFGSSRICRGGSWADSEVKLRATDRSAAYSPANSSETIGFRVAAGR